MYAFTGSNFNLDLNALENQVRITRQFVNSWNIWRSSIEDSQNKVGRENRRRCCPCLLWEKRTIEDVTA